MRKGRQGSALVEVIICSILTAGVLLGGLDLSTSAITIAKTSLAQRKRAASLSSLMGEITAGIVSADARQIYGWGVAIDATMQDQETFGPPVGVVVTGKFRADSVDVRWKEWRVGGRGR
ncbi:MAG: hypothetical protein LBF92_08275 [Synergistaceae bacterium]|nr:hypothetical protein [Synergistaceae bacterium]